MKINDKFDVSWHPIVNVLYQKPLNTLNTEILPSISYQPKTEDIFKVFAMPVKDIKVVIIGQEPSATPGNSNGYAFAVNPTRRMSPTLSVIAKEIENEGLKTGFFDSDIPEWKSLDHLREQGVFLLNTALTVQTGNSGSHIKHWRDFIERVISFISLTKPCVWLLWGKKAQAYIPFINSNPFHVIGYNKETIKEIPSSPDWNYILQAPNPVTETYTSGKAGFYGCNHFQFTNTILERNRNPKINW